MIARAQISVWMDSVFPRDAMIITPHFNNAAFLPGGEDWQDFADDLATAMWQYYNANSRQVNVKIYDAQGTVPVLPVGNVTKGSGLAPPSGIPREVAMCLSYYSGQNQPGKRGRLYVPVCATGLDALSGRPSNFFRDKTLALGGLLKDAGGTDVDWGVFSRRDNQFRPTTNYWVDDEWDTMRSRGLRPTMRVSATASE